MNDKPSFYRPRMVVLDKDRHRDKAQLLSESRSIDAYVLLGEQGAGKTSAFEYESDNTSGGKYVKVRNLSLLTAVEVAGMTLFIDGLDERRAAAGDAHTPLDNIRQQLKALGLPRFRISCREADWLGESDVNAINFIATDGKTEVLHLLPLSEEDIQAILADEGVPNPTAFVASASEYQLEAMLENPQTLKMLVRAVGDKWPKSRKEIYEKACLVEAIEPNKGHQTASSTPAPSTDLLLEAAGFLCATILLSGQEGVTRFPVSDRPEITPLAELADPGLPLLAATRTRLFQDAGGGGRSYSHRTVAEFLAAQYIAKQIESNGLPLGRILALCTGKDGGVSPDLRGLFAWLAVYSKLARLALSDRDPLALILYGDVGQYTPTDKVQLLGALRRAAINYPGFRADDWTSKPFGGLSTHEVQTEILAYLTPVATSDAEQVFQDCVLDAVKSGARMPGLEPALQAIARNSQYWQSVRRTAIEAIAHISASPLGSLRQLLDDIQSGSVEDADDELAGLLLETLYELRGIAAPDVFNYLHTPKQASFIGRYHLFWSYHLPRLALPADLSLLLHEMEIRRPVIDKTIDSHKVDAIAGELVARTLEELGDSASDDELHAWLGVGIAEWGRSRLDAADSKRVSDWVGRRPDRYRRLVEHFVEQCRTSANVANCLVHGGPRIFDANAPDDIVEWYLSKAGNEADVVLAKYYFDKAVVKLHQRDQSEFLLDKSLDQLEAWVQQFPKFEPWRNEVITVPLNHWRRDALLRQKKYDAEKFARMQPIILQFSAQHAAIESGTANPHLMHELAQICAGRRLEGRGETELERLADFFSTETALIHATLAGLPKFSERKDLPTADDVIALHLAGSFHYIRDAALVGMEMRFAAGVEAAFNGLDDATLKCLCAFRLTTASNGDPEWYVALAKQRPEIVAEVLFSYAGKSISGCREHTTGLYQLENSADFEAVAAIVVPRLLEDFPVRSHLNQLPANLDPLLKSALNFMAPHALSLIVSAKLATPTLDAAQRVYWLACGTLIDSDRHLHNLLAFIKTSANRRGHLASFFHEFFNLESSVGRV